MTDLREVFASAADFVRRVLHHGYIVLIGLIGGVLGTYGDLFGGSLALPSWLTWTLLAGAAFIASFLAFHDLRIELKDGSPSSGQDPRFGALSDLLGRSLEVGLELSRSRDAIPLEAWENHTRRLVASAYGEGVAAHTFTPQLREPKIQTDDQRLFGMFLRAPLRAEMINALNDLLGDMPSMAIRDDFDPLSWKAFDSRTFKAENARPAEEIEKQDFWGCPWCSHQQSNYSPPRCEKCGAEYSNGLVYKAERKAA